MDERNLSVIRQSFANVVFTHKVHEIAAEKNEKKVFYINWINIIFVAIIFILLVLQVYTSSTIVSYVAAGISLLEVIFLIIQKSFNYEQRKVAHKNSALKYMDLRDRYLGLIADIMNENITNAMLENKRDTFQLEYQNICDHALPTSRDEYEKAQLRLNKRGIIQGEDFTWSNEEIDRFLPKELRLAFQE